MRQVEVGAGCLPPHSSMQPHQSCRHNIFWCSPITGRHGTIYRAQTEHTRATCARCQRCLGLCTTCRLRGSKAMCFLPLCFLARPRLQLQVVVMFYVSVSNQEKVLCCCCRWHATQPQPKASQSQDMKPKTHAT